MFLATRMNGCGRARKPMGKEGRYHAQSGVASLTQGAGTDPKCAARARLDLDLDSRPCASTGLNTQHRWRRCHQSATGPSNPAQLLTPHAHFRATRALQKYGHLTSFPTPTQRPCLPLPHADNADDLRSSTFWRIPSIYFSS